MDRACATGNPVAQGEPRTGSTWRTLSHLPRAGWSRA